eukprot:COSAG02_NODE_4151_length_5709_cov_21.395187_7_plen_197_part_00
MILRVHPPLLDYRVRTRSTSARRRRSARRRHARSTSPRYRSEPRSRRIVAPAARAYDSRSGAPSPRTHFVRLAACAAPTGSTSTSTAPPLLVLRACRPRGSSQRSPPQPSVPRRSSRTFCVRAPLPHGRVASRCDVCPSHTARTPHRHGWRRLRPLRSSLPRRRYTYSEHGQVERPGRPARELLHPAQYTAACSRP